MGNDKTLVTVYYIFFYKRKKMGKYSYDDLYKKLHERGLEILTDKKDYIDLKGL